MPTETEQAFIDRMVAEGWEVHHNGFPDFLCVKGGETIFVEVKASKTERLKEHQNIIADLLTKNNLKVYRWSPDYPELVSFNQIPNVFSPYKTGLTLHGTLAKRLTPEIVMSILESGVSQKKIAEVAGVSPSRVSQLVAKARKQVILSKAKAKESGQRGGRPSKETKHAELLARAQQIAEENMNSIDTLVER